MSQCNRCTKREARPRSKTCKICSDIRRKSQANYSERLRLQALKVYGNVCTNCGEARNRYLTFDHIQNDGCDERKEHPCRKGVKLYKYLVDEVPTNIQILCFNCNCAKAYRRHSTDIDLVLMDGAGI
jgi:hypothetical protein